MKIRLVEELDFIGNELTPQQSDYFKNSVIREDGKLLICYHGTPNIFDEFQIGDIGFHFGSLAQANDRRHYKHCDIKNWNISACYLNITKPYYWDYDDIGGWNGIGIADAFVFKDDLDASKKLTYQGIKPKHFDVPREFSSHKDFILDVAGRDFKNKDVVIKSSKQMRDMFKSHGYDGIIYKNGLEGDVLNTTEITYIAFEPNQIKSITNLYPTSSVKFDK